LPPVITAVFPCSLFILPYPIINKKLRHKYLMAQASKK